MTLKSHPLDLQTQQTFQSTGDRALGAELGSTVRAELNSPILEMGELRLEPAQDMRARTGAQPLLGSWSLPLSLTREPLLSATLDPEALRDPKDI